MADPTFLIEGRHYPIPTLDTFTIDELDLLYQNCGLTLEDFSIDDDDEVAEAELRDKQKHPGFRRTIVQIAYQRGNPTVKPEVVKKLIGGVSVLEAMRHNTVEEEPEDPTQGSMKPHDEQLDNATGLLNGNGGNFSTPISTVPDTRPAIIGTGGSTMSSLGSPGPTPAA